MIPFFRKQQYEFLPQPFEKRVFDLNPTEATAYFDWYMAALSDRVAYVSQICAKELGVSPARLDLSPDSLVLLWKWFRKRAKTQPGPTPANPKQKVLTPETELLLRDVGMYLGETMRRNLPGLYWTHYTAPKNDFFVNQPLLKGFSEPGHPDFEPVFEPIHMAGVQAMKLLRHESSNYDLCNLYCLWAEKGGKRV